ncbi:NAD(P)H-binding protein [Thalassotalea sp. LPB0316]|uniref:NAD-dependent epimerase/dehydratase family protein n=1 Tax=Thalassotalea sp. LPB0316 TaxID=2769490 RepID=UPI0018679192|nr:NAD(P)H-binding protein [Thalassotalea sp. LPB0316]QOL25263.1 NAD(P)H-binding protein [Thalassotalea sp. LPB0316]
MKVLIFGASGLTGNSLVEQLLDHHAVSEIHLALRKPLNAIKQNDKLHTHIVNFNHHHQLTELIESHKVDVIYCALGTTIKKAGSQAAFKAIDVDLISAIGRAAIASNHCHSFCMISALGADASSSVFYNRCKGLTEQNIIEALQQTTGKNLVICRPSLLSGHRAEFRLGEHIANVISRILPFIYTGRLAKYKPIAVSTLASAMINATLAQPHSNDTTTESKLSIIENDALHRLGQAH